MIIEEGNRKPKNMFLQHFRVVVNILYRDNNVHWLGENFQFCDFMFNKLF